MDWFEGKLFDLLEATQMEQVKNPKSLKVNLKQNPIKWWFKEWEKGRGVWVTIWNSRYSSNDLSTLPWIYV